VFFSHYGGPSAQVVTRGWASPLQQAVVQAGYIWFELDNRGSANRGVAFESQIHHAMGTVEVQDQLAGAAYLKTLPFVDPAKIATYGWSYGGYMTLKLLEAAPGTFAAGIAGAPVTRWELYDTHYTERYMGMPGPAYERANALDDATRIADPLLLVHGLADDNVVFDNSSELIARLQGGAIPFEMMLYPGQTHAVGGPKISVHLWETIMAFLARSGPRFDRRTYGLSGSGGRRDGQCRPRDAEHPRRARVSRRRDRGGGQPALDRHRGRLR